MYSSTYVLYMPAALGKQNSLNILLQQQQQEQKQIYCQNSSRQSVSNTVPLCVLIFSCMCVCVLVFFSVARSAFLSSTLAFFEVD